MDNSDLSSVEEDSSITSDQLPICGLIMPISATANQPADHWRKVRILLSRAINKAGFNPIPVWENVANDRVSERIIGNIFKFPMVVVDVSDLNPNVMLEFGLRLASKKPTIAVINHGGAIPFDIRDFHAIHYPSSLSILEMEEFVEELSNTIRNLYEASKKTGYVPFLGNVVVDVVSPSEREVSVSQFVLDRLDSIERKITSSGPLSPENNFIVYNGRGRIGVIRNSNETMLFADFSKSSDEAIRKFTNKNLTMINPRFNHFSAVGDVGKTKCYALVLNGKVDGDELNNTIQRFREFCIDVGVEFGVPENQTKANWMSA